MELNALRRFLIAAPLAWLIALVGAASIASKPSVGVFAYSFSAMVYGIGSLICHQLPERSFHLWGAQVAVCARCFGLYGGAATAVLVAAVQPLTVERFVKTRPRTLVALAACPTVITLLYEWTSGVMPSHWIRAAAGFVLGAVITLVLLASTTAPRSAVGIN